RTVLAFVIAVREKIQNRGCQPRVAQSMNHRSVNLRVAAPGPLICWATTISDHRNDKPMFDVLRAGFIACKPGDCANGAGRKQESIAISRSQACHPLGKMCEQCHSGAVVVRE